MSNNIPDPILRKEKYLAKIAENTAGGGSDPVILQANKNITANGIVNPDSGFDGFAKVTVDVPNTYSAADEGKVVSEGALISQVSTSVNSNNTYDTTYYNEVTVNVPNTYTAGDEGKVVDNGALVSQTAYPSTVTVNDTYDTTNYNSITVNVPSGGGSVEEKDVNFYDYDGTCVYSYTKAEFLALTEMPANPDRTSEGLTAQGWNWSFADAVDYVTNYGILDIGQSYVTSDGATRFYVNIPYDNFSFYFNSTGYGYKGTIDWGDGNTQTHNLSDSTKYTLHTYTNKGKYVISVKRNEDNDKTINFGGNSSHRFCIFTYNRGEDYGKSCCVILEKIEFGNKVHLYEAAFQYCCNLNSITLPTDITFSNHSSRPYSGISLNESACKHITIPIGKNGYIRFSPRLSTISFPKINNIGNSNYYCIGSNPVLKRFIVPDNITSIPSNTFFSPNTGLRNNTMKCIVMSSTIQTLQSSQFSNMINLIKVDLSKTQITKLTDYCFSSCINLPNVELPNTLTTISDNCFYECGGLKSVTIPNQVSSIGSQVFYECRNLKTIKFEPTTPPTMGSNSFYSVPTDCIIYVPALVSNLYMTGTNYPNPSTYNYIGYATYTSGDTLPTLTTDETYTLTWYATVDDAIAQTNPITQGNGNEVYSRATAVV